MTGVTALMASAGRGEVAFLEQLLAFGADTDVRASNNWTARDFAVRQEQQAAAEVLTSYRYRTCNYTFVPFIYCLLFQGKSVVQQRGLRLRFCGVD